jgi:hypothetical protein
MDSGTSYANPQVAGILARAVGFLGNKPPLKLIQDLKKHAAEAVWGQPPNSGTTYVLISIPSVYFSSNRVEIGIYSHSHG